MADDFFGTKKKCLPLFNHRASVKKQHKGRESKESMELAFTNLFLAFKNLI